MKRKIKALFAELVQRDFPSLCNYDISITNTASPDCVAEVSVHGKEITVELNGADIKRMGIKARKGVFAHELCHVERDLGKSKLHRFAEAALNLVLPSVVEMRDERATDELVIAKGYGRELLAFHSYHDRYYEPYTKWDGLTRQEIRARLKAQRQLESYGR